MSPLIIALVLGAAMLHASWNAVLRGGSDRLWAMTVMSVATSAVAIPWAALVPAPAPASWPYLLASGTLQAAYSYFLVQAYRYGDLAQVYPIARGTAPLLVTLAAALLARDAPALPGLCGIALISAGLIGLSGRVAPGKGRSVVFAIITGAFIAAYTTLDGIGVRLAGASGGYTAWMFLVYGVVMVPGYLALRGPARPRHTAPEAARAAAGGLLSLAAYGVVVFALGRAPIGAVSALRETSVVFAGLLGHFWLGERLTLRRLLFCCVIAAGAALIGWQK